MRYGGRESEIEISMRCRFAPVSDVFGGIRLCSRLYGTICRETGTIKNRHSGG